MCCAPAIAALSIASDSIFIDDLPGGRPSRFPGRLSFCPHGLGCAGFFAPCPMSHFNGPLRVLLVGRYPYIVMSSVLCRCGSAAFWRPSRPVPWFRPDSRAVLRRFLCRFPRSPGRFSAWPSACHSRCESRSVFARKSLIVAKPCINPAKSLPSFRKLLNSR